MGIMDISKKEDIAVETPGIKRDFIVQLSCTNKKSIQSASKEFTTFLSDVCDIKVDPEEVPTAEACFTTRKSPCGNGTATFSRIKLRIFQRKFVLSIADNNMERVTEFLKSSPARAEIAFTQ